MYLLVGDDEHSSEENSEAQLKSKQWNMTHGVHSWSKILGIFLFSFASYKNEVENSYFGMYDNIQKIIKMDSWVCFIWLTFSPILWHVSPVFQAPLDKVFVFQSELDTSNAYAMFQLWFVFDACPQANRTISTKNKKTWKHVPQVDDNHVVFCLNTNIHEI